MGIGPRTYERLLGEVASLRNQVARHRESEHKTSMVDWDTHKGIIIALCGSLQEWLGDMLPQLRAWFIWADRSIQAATIDLWLGYRNGWRKVPTEPYVEDIANYYVRPARQPDIEKGTYRSVQNKSGIEEHLYFKTVRYVRGQIPSGPFIELWHKVVDRKCPSDSALLRCGRLWLVSQLLRRRVLTTRQLELAELLAIRGWLVDATGVALREGAIDVLRRLLVDNEFRKMLAVQPTNDAVPMSNQKEGWNEG